MIVAAFIYRSSDPSGMTILCAIGFCAGIAIFFFGFRLLHRRRLILDTPFSKIRSASMGRVEISGLAVGPYTMIAPITARACYYYRTLVWERKQRGKDKEWVKVAGECMHVPFFVDDNTGRLLIDPRGAELDLHRDFEQEFCDSFFTTRDPVPDTLRRFLARYGIVTNNKIKVEEFCIKPKNSLFILGTLVDNPGLELTPQPVRDQEAPHSFSSHGFSVKIGSVSFTGGDTDVRLTGLARPPAMPSGELEEIQLSSQTSPTKAVDMTQQQKIAAALHKAGISNPAAWAAAGMPLSSGVQVLTDPARPATSGDDGDGFEPHPPVVLMKGTNDKTFLISWRSQQEVARALAWKCLLMIWGGPALALLTLYIVLTIRGLL